MEQLTLHRTFDAPRDVVWRAWTDAALAAQWYGPEHFDCPVYEADVRPGGAIRVHMRAPDGTIFPLVGRVEEARAPERFVTHTRVELGEVIALEARTTTAFAQDGARTAVTVHQEYLRVGKGFEGARAGAEAGWTSSFRKLDALLAREHPAR